MSNINKFGLVSVLGTVAVFGFTAANAQSSADLVAAALNHSDRPSEEAEDDGRRMPLEVLSFAGIEAGMDVLELEAGGGWYTEILARTVGSNGMVYMQNPPAFEGFTGDADDNRAASLSNVTLSTTNFDELEPGNGSIDLVTWILGPHELWFEPQGVSLGDPEQSFTEIARVLKPGGRFLAVDHHAEADAGPEVGGTLHRIPEPIIRDYAEAAGLTLIRSSNLHLNGDDPLTNGVFDPSIQGQTSKFVLLFEK
ncbi:MAG: methyltransferase domain-containing protein [Pseudomonadales bacterium]|nr:methyltransferase domain-containing protein [Pseudomonadales bacterium]